MQELHRDVGGVGSSKRARRSRDIALQRKAPTRLFCQPDASCLRYRPCIWKDLDRASTFENTRSEGVGVLEQSDLELVLACYTEMYVLPRDQTYHRSLMLTTEQAASTPIGYD